MHPIRRQKMQVLLCFMGVIACIVGLVLYALRQNINLFYTPTQLSANHAPHNHAIRLGGVVVEGSIVRGERLNVRFQITDYHDTVNVRYQGILPDLFREGKGVVAEGEWLMNNQFKASSVLAKHDENYMPPEVKEALATYQKSKPLKGEVGS
jgi:cytochrome c-type biogenesis protein CcmE